MVKYVIKHVPSNKYYYEDEGGSFLIDESESFFVLTTKNSLKNLLIHLVMTRAWSALKMVIFHLQSLQ